MRVFQRLLDKVYYCFPLYTRLYMIYRAIARKLQEHGSVTVIDFGSWDGEVLYRIGKLFGSDKVSCVSVDVHIPKNKYSGVEYIEADFTKKFDCGIRGDVVISTHVMEHIPLKKMDWYVKNILKHTKDDGILYIETPSLETLKYPSFSWLKDGNAPLNFRDVFGPKTMAPHVRPYSGRDIFSFFKKYNNQKATLKLLKVGRNINIIAILLAPITVSVAFITRNRNLFSPFFWSITGWASFALFRKIEDK